MCGLRRAMLAYTVGVGGCDRYCWLVLAVLHMARPIFASTYHCAKRHNKPRHDQQPEHLVIRCHGVIRALMVSVAPQPCVVDQSGSLGVPKGFKQGSECLFVRRRSPQRHAIISALLHVWLCMSQTDTRVPIATSGR